MSTIDQPSVARSEKRLIKLPGSESAQEVYLPAATVSAIDKYGMEIVESIEKNGTKFLLTTPIINEDDPYLYPQCLFYVLKDGILFPRLAYKSKSTMKWRICPKREQDEDGAMIYGKGHYSYATETIPFHALSLLLEELLEKGAEFTKESIIIDGDPEIDTYDTEVEPDIVPDSLRHLVNYDPNIAIINTEEEYSYFLTALNPENTPDSFVPDFTKESLSVEKRYSELFGDFNVEKYRVNYEGIDFDFYLASDELMGRVWIDKLERADDDGLLVNSYGTCKKVNGFKAHCLKPVEYVIQCKALNSNIEYIDKDGNVVLKSDTEKPFELILMSGEYGDITEFLEKNKIISKYREAKNIKRKTQEELREERMKRENQVTAARKIFRHAILALAASGLVFYISKMDGC